MLCVTSETGRLRRVLLHEPGPEVDLMVPAMMEELLFDDILFGDRAREEHRRFRRLLQLVGVEVVEANQLLEETLASEEARRWLSGILLADMAHDLREMFEKAPAAELVRTLISGRRRDGEGKASVRDLYRITPLANWCFQRDPQIVFGQGVIFSAMATPARWREALLSRAIFMFHPAFRGAPVWCDPLKAEMEQNLFLGLHRPRLEGGDVLVLSRDLVAVGVSERTNSVAVSLLMRALARKDGAPRYLHVVHLPQRRAYMHLDTVFTPISESAALAFPPVVTGPDSAEVFEVDLHAENPTPKHVGTLVQALEGRGLPFEPIPCGGDDPVHQQREQWTDGANALALAPGVICLYDRNVRTAEALARRGFRVIDAESVLLGGTELNLERTGKTCLLISSNEIARARGGPHCLSHPLVRDEIG